MLQWIASQIASFSPMTKLTLIFTYRLHSKYNKPQFVHDAAYVTEDELRGLNPVEQTELGSFLRTYIQL